MASLTDDSTGIIYYCNLFIVQGTPFPRIEADHSTLFLEAFGQKSQLHFQQQKRVNTSNKKGKVREKRGGRKEVGDGRQQSDQIGRFFVNWATFGSSL